MKHNVLIIGDSHAKGFLPHTRVDSDAIAVALGTPGELRQAVSGSTAQEWACNKDTRLVDAQISAGAAEAVLISLGGNDLFKAAADGIVDDAEIAALCVNLAHVLYELSILSNRTFVLLYGYPYRDVRAQALMALQRLNAVIASTVQTVNEIHGVHIETIDEGQYLTPDDWPGDDIHPFESGYAKIGAEIAMRLEVF